MCINTPHTHYTHTHTHTHTYTHTHIYVIPFYQLRLSTGDRNHSKCFKQKRNLIWEIQWLQNFWKGWRSRSQELPPGYSAQEPITVPIIPKSGSCYYHMTKLKLPINNNVPLTSLASINNSRKIACISLLLLKSSRNAGDWQKWILYQNVHCKGVWGV